MKKKINLFCINILFIFMFGCEKNNIDPGNNFVRRSKEETLVQPTLSFSIIGNGTEAAKVKISIKWEKLDGAISYELVHDSEKAKFGTVQGYAELKKIIFDNSCQNYEHEVAIGVKEFYQLIVKIGEEHIKSDIYEFLIEQNKKQQAIAKAEPKAAVEEGSVTRSKKVETIDEKDAVQETTAAETAAASKAKFTVDGPVAAEEPVIAAAAAAAPVPAPLTAPSTPRAKDLRKRLSETGRSYSSSHLDSFKLKRRNPASPITSRISKSERVNVPVKSPSIIDLTEFDESEPRPVWQRSPKAPSKSTKTLISPQRKIERQIEDEDEADD